ncbi:MAG: hypothetical protein QW648_03690 [Nanoarchaeales archaeon]
MSDKKIVLALKKYFTILTLVLFLFFMFSFMIFITTVIYIKESFHVIIYLLTNILIAIFLTL